MNERLRQEGSTKVSRIDKPEGTYTIMYGPHNQRVNTDLLPEGFDGFVIEWPSDKFGQKLPDYFSGMGRLLLQQFSSILDHAEANRLPVYHADLGIKVIITFTETALLPFQLTSGVREVITAHKEEWLMKNIQGVNHLVTVIGSSHTGIESQIKKTYEDRLKSIQRLLPFIKGVTREKRSIYSIPRFDFNGKEWRLGDVLEVPELRELVS